jgi:hypothetical protein
MIKDMKITQNQEDLEYFLEVIDPYNNQQITFSEVVHLFSSVSNFLNFQHMVPAEDGDDKVTGPKIALLEKFARENEEDSQNNSRQFIPTHI